MRLSLAESRSLRILGYFEVTLAYNASEKPLGEEERYGGTMSGHNLDCSVDEAKAICQKLSHHVTELTIASASALSTQLAPSRAEAVRPAYVLTLLALEETGKMFKIWQTGAKAEDEQSDRVVVEGLFRNHKLKGGLASDICCQIIETIANWIEDMRTTEDPGSQSHQLLSEVQSDFDKTVAHLKSVYRAYEVEREATMYISDDDTAGWNCRRQAVAEVIDNENFLIWAAASIASNYLKTEGSFSLAIKALLDIRKGLNSDQAYAFYGRLMISLARQLGDARKTNL